MMDCHGPGLPYSCLHKTASNSLMEVMLRLHHLARFRDGRPAPQGTLPAGRGGFPAPPRTVGRGGFPAPTRPVKMIKTAGKLRGKIKAYI